MVFPGRFRYRRPMPIDSLLGRDAETRRLVSMLGRARNGRGAALLVSGDPGIGKTALVSTVAADPPGMTTLKVVGFEAESTIPFAAIQRLTIPLQERLAALPDRQRLALAVATGRADGPPPDRFLVGLGLLGLLTATAAVAPVVCVIDEAQHLDAESLDALGLVARRIEAERIALLFAGRVDTGLAQRLVGVPELTLPGLPMDAAVRLLQLSAAGPIDPVAAAAIVDALSGNPLALVDLAVEVSARELSGRGLDGWPVPVGRRLEQHYLRRVGEVDGPAQAWLLLAASDAAAGLDLIGAAADRLGIDPDAGDRAESAGLVELAETVRFRHPLVRSAVYNAASGVDRRRVHRALAAAAVGLGLAEIEAWHAAQATLGTDPEVADRLEHAADLAARRGGFASRASVLTRAADLTPAGARRAERLIGAAEAALMVGAVQVAAGLVGRLDDNALDVVQRARVIVVRYGIALFVADPETLVNGTALLMQAADGFHGHDPLREQRTLLMAFESCVVADRLMVGVTTAELGERLAAGAEMTDGPTSVILRGLSALIRLPYDRAVPLARAAMAQIDRLPEREMMQLGTAITALTTFLADIAGRDAALDRCANAARNAGALQSFDTVLWLISLTQLTGGTVRRAVECVDEVRGVRRAMGYDSEQVVNPAVIAWTGGPREVVRQIGEGAGAGGFGGVTAVATWALAVRDLAEGHYRDAYRLLQPQIADPFLQVTPLQYSDFVEAAVRSGHEEEAARWVTEMGRRAAVNGSPWYRGVTLRSRALVAPNDEAEAHFRTAITALTDTGALIDLARAHLLYGEWLRRTRRRGDARHQLTSALELFERGGGEIFVGRVRAEIEATGARNVAAQEHDPLALTAQELTIARRAAAGHTNAEIAGALFISPNTVDYHLRKVFGKLGISSRRQLADRLDHRDPGAPAGKL